jgi:glycosyltransferase involved in cell wall biosynthesis
VTTLEIVADLRTVTPETALDVVRQWAAADPCADLIARATFVAPRAPDAPPALPPGWQIVTDPIAPGLWDAVFTAAGRNDHAVVTLLGPVLPGAEAVGVMTDLLETDAMLGAAAAREMCTRGCCVRTQSAAGGPDPEWIPHAAVAELPPHELLGNVLAPCMVLKPILLTDFGAADAPYVSLAGTLLHRLISARRCGFRSVLANRAVVSVAGADCAKAPVRLVSVPPEDMGRLRKFGSEIDRGWSEFRGASTELLERLTGRHLKTASGLTPPSLLLDMRNVRATYNGTTFAAIGAAWGLYRCLEGWNVAILAHPAGAAFHEFESAFPGWMIHTSPPSTGFNVALRLSQPWHIQDMIDLHLAARVNAYLILDTIAWDVLYAAPPHLDGTWHFLSTAADGLLFISEFSRQRFHGRFPTSERRIDAVCHLSFNPNDYSRPELLDAREDDYILVIGNQLDHKDVSSTVGLLASAFPFARIEALGPSPVRSPHVQTHASGNLGEVDVHRLYASARLAVFPSFYEGFGFPVVTALAYGRTLLARESSLLTEVAANCQPRGRLISFRQRDELVDRIGRLLHGEPVPERTIGSALNGGSCRSWKDVGREIETFLRKLIASTSTASWRARDHLVREAIAYRHADH